MGIVARGILQDITLRLSSIAKAKVFIETGTHHGETTKWAAEYYDDVYTIELAESLYRQHCNELKAINGVFPYFGNSAQVLPDILEKIGQQPAVFWLDGHWSGAETGGKENECPLLGELHALGNRREDIILIDDARLFLCSPPAPHNPDMWPTLKEVVHALPEMGENHFIQIVNDVIFIVPDNSALKAELLNYVGNNSNQLWNKFLMGESL